MDVPVRSIIEHSLPLLARIQTCLAGIATEQWCGMVDLRTALDVFGKQPSARNRTALLRVACAEITNQTRAQRASVWALSPDLDRLTCLYLWDSRSDQATTGQVLHRHDFAGYFSAIIQDGRVVANDARSHPATVCFLDGYLIPFGIHALLDSVVMVDGQLIAVLCCEHCDGPRTWVPSDLGYLEAVAKVMARTLSQLVSNDFPDR